jgi:hypothetical protein
MDGNSSYQVNAVSLQYRGKGFNVASFYKEYDWVAGNGYNNFASYSPRAAQLNEVPGGWEAKNRSTNQQCSSRRK